MVKFDAKNVLEHVFTHVIASDVRSVCIVHSISVL